MKTSRKLLLLNAFVMLFSWPATSAAGETLVLASRADTLTNRFAEQVLTEAYARLNMKIKFAIYPDARSVIEANAGRADGEVARLGTVLNRYQNLKKIPVPIFHSELSAFVNKEYKYRISDWKSLRNYSLTTIRGFLFVQNKLADFSPRIVGTSADAIQLIENDRVEVAVLNRFLGLRAIAAGYGKRVKVHSPALERLPVYHLLHKKHERLIPKLTAVLKAMEQDGRLRSMWEDFTTRETQKVASKSASPTPEVYILNTSTRAPYATPQRTGFQDLVVAEVFRRIGLKGRVSMYNASARALINANENIDHGVAMRVKGLEKKFRNLVRVNERLIKNEFVAYSKGLKLITDDWDKLKPHTIAHIRGWVIFERNLRATQRKFAVKNPDHMFTMLVKGRVELVLYERWQGLQRARDSGIKVTVHEPPLATVDMYMYMHKNHAALAPKMAQALRDMKTDGTYQAIYGKVLTPLAVGG